MGDHSANTCDQSPILPSSPFRSPSPTRAFAEVGGGTGPAVFPMTADSLTARQFEDVSDETMGILPPFPVAVAEGNTSATVCKQQAVVHVHKYPPPSLPNTVAPAQIELEPVPQPQQSSQ